MTPDNKIEWPLFMHGDLVDVRTPDGEELTATFCSGQGEYWWIHNGKEISVSFYGKAHIDKFIIVKKYINFFKRYTKTQKLFKTPKSGEYWIIRHATNGIALSIKVKIIEVKDGWVMYSFRDNASFTPRRKVNLFTRIYKVMK